STRRALSSRFPYTTLFRSAVTATCVSRPCRDPSQRTRFRVCQRGAGAQRDAFTSPRSTPIHGNALGGGGGDAEQGVAGDRQELRSEEHTSELQSRENLVCR